MYLRCIETLALFNSCFYFCFLISQNGKVLLYQTIWHQNTANLEMVLAVELRVKLEWDTIIFYEKGSEWIHVVNKEKWLYWPLMHYCCVINGHDSSWCMERFVDKSAIYRMLWTQHTAGACALNDVMSGKSLADSSNPYAIWS